jgi:hypothetical protein
MLGEFALATDVAANTANRDADLGSAYQSEKELFVGQSCVVGNTSSTGAPISTFSFDQSLTESQASNELGFDVGGRARFGVVEASASSRFMRGSVSNQYSVSAVWLSEYRLPTQRLSTVQKNDIGNAVYENHERWAETCGDEYVEEITKGAKLFFSIRVDFGSAEQKQQFEAKFQISGPLYSANADLSTASKQFSQNVKITVSALQIGGDVSKITGLFDNTGTGQTGFIQCTLGDFSKCAQVISAAIGYATDTVHGFPSQIAPGAMPGPASLTYRTAKYSAAGIYLSNYPYLDQANQEARGRLQSDFEKQFSLQVLADRLLDEGMGDKQESLKKQRDKIDFNISKILETSKTCYTTPLHCTDAVTSLQLETIDESLFVLPPLPAASFRVMTASKGIWSRQDSCDYMNKTISFEITLPLTNIKRPVTRFHNMSDFDPKEGASVILLVEGQSLKQAEFRFENQLISTIPLIDNGGAYPGKIVGDQAAIVLETNRKNPGWQDVDIQQSQYSFEDKDLPEADGVFYILVKDAFGRSTRFDLEYAKWSQTKVTAEDGEVTTYRKGSTRTRWWDPDGNGLSLFVTDKYTRESAYGYK